MDLIKIQSKFLRSLFYGENVSLVEGVDGRIGITDEHAVYFMPDSQFYLKGFNRSLDVKRIGILNHLDNSKLVQPDRIEKIKGGEIVRLSNDSKDISVWVQKKYLSSFGKYDAYYASDPRNPLYVMDENMEVEAAILPVAKTTN